MNNKGTFDTNGQKADLKSGSATNMERTPTESGTFQTFAQKAPLSMTPGNSTPERPVPSPGSIQTFGQKADLNRDAHRGYSGDNTPMSKRSEKQSGNG